MKTRQDAVDFVITCIEANGTDIASREEFDIDGIVDDLLPAAAGYDLSVIDPDYFWDAVQRFDNAAQS